MINQQNLFGEKINKEVCPICKIRYVYKKNKKLKTRTVTREFWSCKVCCKNMSARAYNQFLIDHQDKILDKENNDNDRKMELQFEDLLIRLKYIEKQQKNKKEKTCPACKKGYLIRRKSKFKEGKYWQGCSEYPRCTFTSSCK